MPTFSTESALSFMLETACGDWISISVGDDRAWHSFVDAIGAPDFCMSPLFATSALRLRHRRSLERCLRFLFLQCTAAEWAEVIDVAPSNKIIPTLAILASLMAGIPSVSYRAG